MAGPNAGNGDLGFAAELFKAADKLRQNVEPSEYTLKVLAQEHFTWGLQPDAHRHLDC